mgnify:CR=1 FL=1
MERGKKHQFFCGGWLKIRERSIFPNLFAPYDLLQLFRKTGAVQGFPQKAIKAIIADCADHIQVNRVGNDPGIFQLFTGAKVGINFKTIDSWEFNIKKNDVDDGQPINHAVQIVYIVYPKSDDIVFNKQARQNLNIDGLIIDNECSYLGHGKPFFTVSQAKVFHRLKCGGYNRETSANRLVLG